MRLRRLQPSESRELRQWIIERHYLKSAPPGYRVALEFLNGNDRIGGMLLGRPTSRELDPGFWLELTRMFFLDVQIPGPNGFLRNHESWALARMRKWVRVWMPGIRGLISYSDPGVGHAGTVYLADGWAPFGTTKARHDHAGWQSREGRRGEESYSRKVRWVRTP
jgi:hypothetical protein